MAPFAPNRPDQGGFALVQVLVALGLLGIVASLFATTMGQTIKAQKITRLQGERHDLRNVFRGAVTCETHCDDLTRDLPRVVGGWEVRLKCSGGGNAPVVEVRHPELSAGDWRRLYEQGAERAVCRNVAQLPTPPLPAGQPEPVRRRMCPPGQRVAQVNFNAQTISCQ